MACEIWDLLKTKYLWMNKYKNENIPAGYCLGEDNAIGISGRGVAHKVTDKAV